MSGFNKNSLLALDLSSSCCGFSLFDITSKILIVSGTIKSSTAGISKLPKLLLKLRKLEILADLIYKLVNKYTPKKIVIEEICMGKNRISQKTLDGFHFLVLSRLKEQLREDIIDFIDVSMWRKILDIKLSVQDKINNKSARKLNQVIHLKHPKLRIVGWKNLSCRFVNKEFGKKLYCNKVITDGDEADAICIGLAYLKLER